MATATKAPPSRVEQIRESIAEGEQMLAALEQQIRENPRSIKRSDWLNELDGLAERLEGLRKALVRAEQQAADALAAAAREKAWAALAERREVAVKAYEDARVDLNAAIDELGEVSRLCAVQAGRSALAGQLPRHLAAAIRLKQLGDGRIQPEAIS